MLKSPRFEDIENPGQGVESVFYEVTEGLKNIRPEIGDENYASFVEKAARMRALFEADPEDKTPDSIAARELIHEIEDVLLEIEQQQLNTGKA